MGGDKMDKLKFSECEVLSYLEEKILDNIATEDEIKLYQDYLLFGELKKFNCTYKQLVLQMRELFEHTY
jgi:hypothetical protein